MNRQTAIACCALVWTGCVFNTETVDEVVEAHANDSQPAWSVLRVEQCSLVLFLVDEQSCARTADLVIRGRDATTTLGRMHVRGYAVGGFDAVRDSVHLGMWSETFSGSSVLNVQPIGVDDDPFGRTLALTSIELRVPRDRGVDAVWPGGTLDVDDFDGDFTIDDGSGSGLSKASDQIAGRIRIGGAAAIELHNVTRTLELEAGSVKLASRNGDLRVIAHGHAEVTSAQAQLQLRAQSAKLDGCERGIKGDVVGRADVSSDGPVALRVGGGGVIESRGAAPIEVVVTGTEFESLELKSERGAIRLRVPPGAAFGFELDSKAGASIELGELHMRGPSIATEVGTGGPHIAAHSGGVIEVLEDAELAP